MSMSMKSLVQASLRGVARSAKATRNSTTRPFQGFRQNKAFNAPKNGRFFSSVKDAEVKDAEVKEMGMDDLPNMTHEEAKAMMDELKNEFEGLNVTDASNMATTEEEKRLAEEFMKENPEKKKGSKKGRDEMKMKAENTEEVTGKTETKSFQAETKKILEIVTNSIYTDREVFLRELISNASDALEKARYLQTVKGKDLLDSELPLEIRMFTDVDRGTITIQDFGVGMTGEELGKNLGTIARSGSKEFVSALMESKESGHDGAEGNIIGQFGVGFYSCFMIADHVEVFSQTADASATASGSIWTSAGDGEYEIAEASGVRRGTKIVMHLKDDCKEFASEHVLQGVVKKYSNFVGFPIYLNGKELNTVQAVWALPKNEVTESQHTDFYRFVSNSYDTPSFRMHFQTDAPLDINALFYFPERHMEKYGMGRQDMGVGLYSRKVMIQGKCETILPPWLRFVKGVVDSEDLPLNLSRETMQDSVLINRLNNVLTKRIIKFLSTEARKDEDKYNKWIKEFGLFLKEGVCSDFQNKEKIAGLLRYESSSLKAKEVTSLDDYISRMPPHQKNIYYLTVSSREYADVSPYFEKFKKDGIEVLFMYDHVDEFAMKNCREYQHKKLVSIESGDVEMEPGKESEQDKKEREEDVKKQAEGNKQLVDYVTNTLGSKVSSVKTTDRLVDSPAIIVDHEPAAVRKVMRMVESSDYQATLPKQKLEINPEHPIFQKLLNARMQNPDLADLIVEQVFDNALVAADLMDSPRAMLPRLNKLLDTVVGNPKPYTEE